VTTISARLVEDSISAAGVRLSTLELRYPRFFHQELLTHRAMARNASSSRAIPTATMLRMLEADPALPLHIGLDQRGMQATKEVEDSGQRMAVLSLSKQALRKAIRATKEMTELFGVAKQVANRITEPWQHINVIVSATDWENFFALRCHPDAEPHFRALAWLIADAYYGSTPKPVAAGGWHLPYLMPEDMDLSIEVQKKVSAARCARVSYKLFDGSNPSLEGDLALCDKLLAGLRAGGGEPGHLSPFEHQAQALASADERSGPFRGWRQHRKEYVGENMTFDYEAAKAKGWRDTALAILEKRKDP